MELYRDELQQELQDVQQELQELEIVEQLQEVQHQSWELEMEKMELQLQQLRMLDPREMEAQLEKLQQAFKVSTFNLLRLIIGFLNSQHAFHT